MDTEVIKAAIKRSRIMHCVIYSIFTESISAKRNIFLEIEYFFQRQDDFDSDISISTFDVT